MRGRRRLCKDAADEKAPTPVRSSLLVARPVITDPRRPGCRPERTRMVEVSTRLRISFAHHPAGIAR